MVTVIVEGEKNEIKIKMKKNMDNMKKRVDMREKK